MRNFREERAKEMVNIWVNTVSPWTIYDWKEKLGTLSGGEFHVWDITPMTTVIIKRTSGGSEASTFYLRQ